MEAIAAVSNVASIISLAVNAVNGTITLRGFFKDYASASKSVDRFLCELNSLIQTLKDVTDIVLKLDNMSSFEEKAILHSCYRWKGNYGIVKRMCMVGFALGVSLVLGRFLGVRLCSRSFWLLSTKRELRTSLGILQATRPILV
jgi:hypothetical protein